MACSVSSASASFSGASCHRAASSLNRPAAYSGPPPSHHTATSCPRKNRVISARLVVSLIPPSRPRRAQAAPERTRGHEPRVVRLPIFGEPHIHRVSVEAARRRGVVLHPVVRKRHHRAAPARVEVAVLHPPVRHPDE